LADRFNDLTMAKSDLCKICSYRKSHVEEHDTCLFCRRTKKGSNCDEACKTCSLISSNQMIQLEEGLTSRALRKM